MSTYRNGSPSDIRQRHRKAWRRLIAMIRALKDRKCEFCSGPIVTHGTVHLHKRSIRFCSRKCGKLAWAEKHEPLRSAKDLRGAGLSPSQASELSARTLIVRPRAEKRTIMRSQASWPGSVGAPRAVTSQQDAER